MRRAPLSTHLVVLALAYALSLLASVALVRLLPTETGALEEARRLGIMSLTIRDGYSKAHETTVYVFLELSVALGTLGLWWLYWRSRKGAPSDSPLPASPLRGEELVSRRSWRLQVFDWILVPLLVVYVTADVHRLGTWFLERQTLLSEEGLLLSSVQRLLEGGVPYRDELVMYGPGMIYPLRGFMAVFGPSVLVARSWFLLLDVAGLVVIYHALRVFLRHRGLAAFGLVFFLAELALLPKDTGAIYRSAAQESVLRFTGSFAWLIFFAGGKGETWRLLATGAAIGLALAFSQEVGVVALLSFVAVASTLPGRRRTFSLAALGAALVLVPLCLAMAVQGSLGDMLHMGFERARLTTLGHANIPFPTPGQLPLVWWIPFALSLGSIALGARLLLGLQDGDDRVVLGLLVAGGLGFRTTLARSDATHALVPMVPAVLLAFVLLRLYLAALTSGETRLASPGGLVVLVLALLSGFCLVPSPTVLRDFVSRNVFAPWSKLRPTPLPGIPPLRKLQGIPRAGRIRVPLDLADELEATLAYVSSSTRPGEPILAWPNDALYYFLADRPNPTRFPTAHMAVTRADREQFVRDLERTRPLLVLTSKDGLRPDDLPDELMYPEVVDYLRRRYRPDVSFGGTDILRRIDPPGDGGR